MSFLRALFDPGGGTVDALLERVASGDAKSVVQLKDTVKRETKGVGQRVIPTLMTALNTVLPDEVVSDIYTILNRLLRSGCDERRANAQLILEQPQCLRVFAVGVTSDNEKKRAASITILMSIADLQPESLRTVMLSNKDDASKIIACVGDSSEGVGKVLLERLPALIGDDEQMKDLVAASAMGPLVQGFTETKDVLKSVLESNAALNMFVSGGFLKNVVENGSDEALEIAETIIKRGGKDTEVVDILIDKMIQPQRSDKVCAMVPMMIRGSADVAEALTGRLGQLITVYDADETFPLFEVLSAYIEVLPENGEKLAHLVVDSGKVSDVMIDVGTFCCLTVPKCKKLFESFFIGVLDQISESSYNGFRFLVTICWNSRQYCLEVLRSESFPKIVNCFVQRTIQDDVKELISFLFCELLLIEGVISAHLEAFVLQVDGGAVLELINSADINEASRFGALQETIRQRANAQSSKLLTNQSEELTKKVDLLQRENTELREKVTIGNESAKQLESERVKLECELSQVREAKAQIEASMENEKMDRDKRQRLEQEELKLLEAENDELKQAKNKIEAELEMSNQEHKREMEKIKAEKEKELESLGDEKDKLESSLQELMEEKSRLSSELKLKSEVEAKLAVVSESNIQLESEVAALRAEIEMNKRDKESVEGKYTEIETALIGVEKRKAVLEAAVKDLNWQVSTLTTENQRMESVCLERDELVSKLKQVNEMQKQQLKDKIRERESTIENLKGIEEELRGVRVDNESLRGELVKFKNLNEELKSTVCKHESTIDSLRKELASREKDIKEQNEQEEMELRNELLALKKKLEEVNQANSSLESSLQIRTREVEQLKQFQEEHSRLVSEKESIARELCHLKENDLKELRRVQSDLTLEKESLSFEKLRLESLLRDRASEIENLKGIEEELRGVRVDNESLRGELVKSKNLNEELESTIDSLRKELASREKDIKEQNEQEEMELRNELLALKKKLEEVNQANSSLESSLQIRTREVETLKQFQEEHFRLVSEKENDLKELRCVESDLTLENESLSSEKLRLESLLRDRTSEVETLKQTNSHADALICKYKSDLTKLTAEMDAQIERMCREKDLELKELREQVSRSQSLVQTEVDTLKASNAKLQLETEHLQAELASKDKSITKLETLLAESKSEIQQMQAQFNKKEHESEALLRQSNERLQKLNISLRERELEIEQLKEDLQKAPDENRHSQLESECQKQEEKIQRLLDEKADLEKRFEEMESLVQTQKLQQDSSNQVNGKLELEVQRLKSQLENLKESNAEKAELESKLSEKERGLLSCEAELTKLKEESQMKRKLDILSAEKANLECELTQMRESNAKLESVNLALQSDIQELNSEKQETEAKLANLDKSKKQLELKIRNQETQIEKLNQNLKSERKQLEKACEKKKTLKKALEKKIQITTSLREQIERTNQELQSEMKIKTKLSEKFSLLEQDNNSLEKQLKQTQETNLQLESSARTHKSELEKMKRQLKSQFNQCQLLKTKNGNLETDLKEANNSKKQIESEMSRMKAQHDHEKHRLETELNNANDAISHLEMALRESNSQIESHQNEQETLKYAINALISRFGTGPPGVTLKSAVDKLLSEFKRVIQQNTQVQSQLEKLQKDYGDVQAELTVSQGMCASKDDRISDYERQLSEQVSTTDRYVEKVQSLKQDLEKQNRDIRNTLERLHLSEEPSVNTEAYETEIRKLQGIIQTLQNQIEEQHQVSASIKEHAIMKVKDAEAAHHEEIVQKQKEHERELREMRRTQQRLVSELKRAHSVSLRELTQENEELHAQVDHLSQMSQKWESLTVDNEKLMQENSQLREQCDLLVRESRIHPDLQRNEEMKAKLETLEKQVFALNQRLEDSGSKSVRQATASEIIVESLDGDTPIKAKESRRREIRKLRSERRIMKEKVKKILLESGSEEVPKKDKERRIRETEAQMHATRLEIERQKAEEKKLRDEIGENRRVLAKIGKAFSHTKTRMFV